MWIYLQPFAFCDFVGVELRQCTFVYKLCLFQITWLVILFPVHQSCNDGNVHLSDKLGVWNVALHAVQLCLKGFRHRSNTFHCSACQWQWSLSQQETHQGSWLLCCSSLHSEPQINFGKRVWLTWVFSSGQRVWIKENLLLCVAKVKVKRHHEWIPM